VVDHINTRRKEEEKDIYQEKNNQTLSIHGRQQRRGIIGCIDVDRIKKNEINEEKRDIESSDP